MLRKVPFIVVAVAALVGIATRGAAQKPGDKADRQAREAVDQFFKALKGKDLDGLMKVSDVPFCREGGMNIAKRDDLKQYFQKQYLDRDFSKDTVAVKLVATLAKFEEMLGPSTADELKAMQEALGKDHRIVEVEWNRITQGGGKHRTMIFIRFQGGTARVVGIL